MHFQSVLLTSMMPPASAIHPKGPPMLVSLVTGAKRFANRILHKFPNKSSPVQDVGQQGVVQLGGVVAAEDEEDAGADALRQVTLVAEQAGETVDEPIAWQKLANSHQR